MSKSQIFLSHERGTETFDRQYEKKKRKNKVNMYLIVKIYVVIIRMKQCYVCADLGIKISSKLCLDLSELVIGIGF